MWPSERVLADEQQQHQEEGEGEGGELLLQGEAVMEGVEHLGQYVFEMTSTRVKQLREERGLAGDVPVEAAVEEIEEGYGGLEVVEEAGEEEGEGEGEEVEGLVRGEGFEVEEE